MPIDLNRNHEGFDKAAAKKILRLANSYSELSQGEDTKVIASALLTLYMHVITNSPDEDHIHWLINELGRFYNSALAGAITVQSMPEEEIH